MRSLPTFLLTLLVSTAAAAPPVADPCAHRPGCRIAQRLPAGEAEGRPLTVLRVAVDPRDVAEAPPDITYGNDECVPYEWWLVHGERARKLIRLCNDGYGAAGLGEDHVDVGPNRFEHVQSGGSSWRGSERTLLQLAPLRLLATGNDGYWTLGSNEQSCTWDRTTWRGGCTWSAPRCDAQGDPPADPDGADRGGGAFQWLPAPSLPDPWRAGGWKQSSLGTCAAEAEHTVHGEAGAPGDARLRAVLGPEGELYVEVEDDRWQRGAKSWLHDDHLEVWVGPAFSYMDHCLARDAKPLQWGIGVLDDRIHPAFGKPARRPTVERVTVGDPPTAVRLKIRLPAAPEAITVVYSDSDDGARQERLLATSALRHGDATTLGRPRPISPDDAVCAVEAGRLDFRDTWRPPATGAVLPGAEEPAGEAPGPDLARLAWLAGAWRGAGTEEVWLAPAGGLMPGLNRTVHEGRASFEFLRIEQRPDGIAYVASPGGGPPTTFRLVAQAEREAVFEDPAHDFPRRITYRRQDDRLHVRLEGVEGGKPRVLTFEWQQGPLIP